MTEVITVTIDGRKIQAAPHTTILEAARGAHIDIPTLCYNESLTPYGACRLCMVEITEGKRTRLVASCIYEISEGLVVETDTPRVKNVRRLVMELLLARNPKALKRFSAAFEAREVEKVYFGIVAGPVTGEEGEIALNLSKVSTAKEGWRMIPAKKGKPALTRWRKIAEHGGNTLVEFRPETGRTHQIRVHAASGLGHALLGDPVYGSAKGAARTMLHAHSLWVPREGKDPIAATAPFPPDFLALGFTDG